MKIIFRVDKKTKGVVAFFKGEKVLNNNIACYSHIGQHGAASYDYYLNNTRPALKKEYNILLKELKSIGYKKIKILKRGIR